MLARRTLLRAGVAAGLAMPSIPELPNPAGPCA
jgi:hypothetical protein